MQFVECDKYKVGLFAYGDLTAVSSALQLCAVCRCESYQLFGGNACRVVGCALSEQCGEVHFLHYILCIVGSVGVGTKCHIYTAVKQ